MLAHVVERADDSVPEQPRPHAIQIGGVDVEVPFAMAEPKSDAFLSAGLQTLFGTDALAFSRNRTIPGGDFTRSFHHGLVVLGALGKKKREEGLDSSGLAGLLGSVKKEIERREPSSAGLLGSLLDQDGDGDTDLGDVAKCLGKLFG